MSATASVFTPSADSRHTASVRALATVSKLAGVSLKTPLDEVRLTQRGIAAVAFDALKQFGASASELHWIIKPRTLAHRKSKAECLTQEETGRWLRAAKAQALALEVFGDQEKAVVWLHKSRRRFADQSAMEILQSEAGAQLIEDTLNQIDAGYYA